MSVQTKISEKTKKICDEVSKLSHDSRISILEKAIVNYRRKLRMENLNCAFAKIEKDEKFKKELSELEGTLLDGLEEE